MTCNLLLTGNSGKQTGAVCSVKLEDGCGVLMQAGMVEVRQKDMTLPAGLRTHLTQSLIFELAELRKIRRAALAGRDWRSGSDRAHHMGAGMMVVEQEDPEAPSRGSPSIYQRAVPTLEDIGTLIALAA